MACIIKLKDHVYIEYNKSSDTFSSALLNKEEVMNVLRADAVVRRIKKPDLDIEKDARNLFMFLEQNGTTDLGRGVNLKFVLKYNESGEGGLPLTLDQILNNFKK